MLEHSWERGPAVSIAFVKLPLLRVCAVRISNRSAFIPVREISTTLLLIDHGYE